MLGSKTDDHEPLDPAETLMREVGAQLRQVRLERGQELDEVALHLRIKSTYLFGIEQGDLSRMPGRTYALGFLRSYADYLGFDGDDLIVQIKSSVANLTDKTRLRIRTPLPESRLPKAPLLVISLLAIAAIYGGWSYLGRSGQLTVETVAEVPGNLRSMALDALSGESRAPLAPPGPLVDGAALPPMVGVLPEGASAPPAGAEPPVRTAAPPADTLRPPARAAVTPPGPALAPAEALAGRSTGSLEIDEHGLSLVRPEAGSERRLAAIDPADPADPAPAALPSAGPPTPPAAAATAAGGPQADATPVEDLARRAEQPSLGATAPGDDPAPAEETLAALAPAAGIPAGEVYEAENTDARVVLRALDSSWVRISSLGGDYLRTRTLQPGDIFLVPNRNDLELWTGNAGGIEVILDGAALAPVGEDGAVVREVPLDPPSLRARFGRL